ncbi:SDR family NAD(P)-dependent oxidoreductase [Paraglaciecola polaris]|uniref:Cyclopentanol dehydrogenase n=1 Tax=Paraglaciecola polaris LMG 21857 TaxID=1129793 RepID=K6YEE5_9ALTE|nr:SDR family oxidoreductase [Paraglaciecola polaris]GAC31119.1 cyclopentanol dehydrogenase [Paraglaciecola polaris LMG 21857]
MTEQLQQKVCIVTGGSFGIGSAICQLFANKGYRVFNLDLHAPTPILGEQSSNIQWLQCDVSQINQVQNAMQNVLALSPKVDCLISNAGVHLSANIEQTSEADLDRMFAINVKGAYGAIQGVLPSMVKHQGGSIILMASDQALIAKHNSFAYNLTKSALASMAKTTALDYAMYNIRANAVCPGTIETPLYHTAIDKYLAQSGRDAQEVHAEEAALQPLGRLGQPDEVAQLCYFLASENAQFITGSLQVIDGGYTAQ